MSTDQFTVAKPAKLIIEVTAEGNWTIVSWVVYSPSGEFYATGVGEAEATKELATLLTGVIGDWLRNDEGDRNRAARP